MVYSDALLRCFLGKTGKPRETVIRSTNLWTEIQIQVLPDMKDCQPLDWMFDVIRCGAGTFIGGGGGTNIKLQHYHVLGC
jgi:hypothetical protein